MRSALVFSLLLVFAACDSVGPTDREALVGSWRVTALDTDLQVTSTIDQSVPDLSGPGSGGIVVTGAETATLRYVAGVTVDDDVRAISFADRNDFETPYTALSLIQGSFGDSVALYIESETTSTLYESPTPEGLTFAYADGLFTVPQIPLDDGAGAQVTAGGTLRVPTVSLPAGVSTVVPGQGVSTTLDLTFSFADDGTFTAAFDENDEARGTWTATDDGRVTVRVTEAGSVEQVTFDFEVRDGRLTLSAEAGDLCDAECRDAFAANTLAAPRSYAALDIVERYSLVRSSGAAALRVEPRETARPWAPRPWRSLTR